MKRVVLILLGLIFVAAVVIVGGRLLTPEDTWICEDGRWVKHGNPRTPMPTSLCEAKIPTGQGATGGVSTPNPASKNCLDKGGKLETLRETAGELGICKFNDGTECEEWQFFRGECKKGQTTKADTSHPYRGKISANKNVYLFKDETGTEYTLNLPAGISKELKDRVTIEAKSKETVAIVAAETPSLSKILILKGFQEK